jgi:hypothetical protein
MRIKLRGAIVRRSGVTARHWDPGTKEILLLNDEPGEGVRSRFDIASKGGGRTEIEYVYGRRHYAAHLRMMVGNDRQAAISAMCDVLRREMAGLEKRERSIERRAAEAARQELASEARSRWIDEPSGTKRDAVARTVLDGIEKLVRAIERKKRRS